LHLQLDCGLDSSDSLHTLVWLMGQTRLDALLVLSLKAGAGGGL
jgi:hypothetical protein